MNKIARILLTLSSLLVVFPFILLADEDLNSIAAKGKEYADKRDYEKAAKEYQKLVAANPRDQKSHLLLGLTYSAAGKPEEAIKYTQAALRLQPSYSGFHNLGLIYANQRDYPKAIDAYQQALKLNPASYRAWYQLGLVYASDLKFKEAIDAYQKVIEINPRFTDAYLGLGSAYYWSGDAAKAREQVEALRAVKDKSNADALADWIENKETQKKAQGGRTPGPVDLQAEAAAN